MLLMIIPFVLTDAGIMHCLAVAPTLVLSILFIILYLVDQVHDLAEQMYLILQMIFNILALLAVMSVKTSSSPLYVLFYMHLFCALAIDFYYVTKERGFSMVFALLLNVITHVVQPLDMLYCLVAGPTLMASLYIMILYVVDQVQYEAELYFVLMESFITFIALLNLLRIGKLIGAIYGLFYIDLLIAFSLDIYYMQKERGWTF